ncbi:hypothetical protein P153DRAFT_364920 [Dothidotthia symphoricarpi CBS 119687]|uniref:Myosin class II heavy chain n=1 Tax=Dothidotthia symphoricarpi CBS 119687 TaxID=1392245 RepID=A0A6A6ALI6_9PLEO|nr:uncharacterized protein P153DRAFT_364920 [Dothidotthia symphoricarpi CBS 119687]KAF2131321.1 hypothetical protein P153DRAFT_364920 [Dothidotthia symphoricarpi CBS 119687]
MHARRIPSSPSSPPPPSSPPAFPQTFGDASFSPEARGALSPTQTLWTAQSPTLTLGHSSPELPPLFSRSALGGNPRTPSTAARHERTDTSYYTASWGSPYRNSPPTFDHQRHASAHFGSDDLDEGSSSLQFGLEHLLPPRLGVEDDSPNRFNLDHLIPRLEQNASPNRFTLEHLIQSRLPHIETPTREPTPCVSDSNPTSEEWIHHFLSERWNRDKNDWKSESGDIRPEIEPQHKQNLAAPESPTRGHKARSFNKTLNQQDFWRHFSSDQKEAFGKMMASKYAESPVAPHLSGASGHDLPTLRTAMPQNIHAERSPISPQLLTPSKPTESMRESLNKTPTPFDSVRQPTPRTRKKVMVKGKGCIISIPHDIPRGTPGYPPKPMSAEAVHTKLQQFQNQGYDTNGFGHWRGENSAGDPPHNRAIWPEEDDVRAERANAKSQFRVRVAKKAEWDTYVNSLLEAKLAALGVSQGGEDDMPMPMSRSGSTQQYPGLPFSPPLPPSSAGSHIRMRQGSIVTGPFPHGPSPGHMSRQSIASPGHMTRQSIASPGYMMGHMSRQSMASPAAFSNVRPNMHMHRHSTFASPANFAQHAISPSGTWSPSGYFGSQDGRGPSPGLPMGRPEYSNLPSPLTPFGMRPNQQFSNAPPHNDDLMAQMQMQQQQLQTQLFQQQQQQHLQQQQQQQQQLLGLRPSSTLAEVPEDEGEEDELPALKHAVQSVPEIAVPTPRHRHNISENLEREAADAEYHLEEAIDKQFAEGGDFNTEHETTGQFKPSKAVTNSSWDSSRAILHQPQPHSRAHSITKSQQPRSFAFPAQQQQNPRENSDGARTTGSVNSIPSLEDGEIRETTQTSTQHSKVSSQVSNPWKDNKFATVNPAVHSKHASRSSISKLNVEAKEFKFNPAASFNPGTFSSGFAFAPAPAVKSPADALPRGNKPSIDGISSFNVTAPAFKPTAPTFQPVAEIPVKPVEATPASPVTEVTETKPVDTNGSAFPSSGFNFSSPPSIKPDAASFNNTLSGDPDKPTPAPTSFSSKIFGDVNISASDIVKPAMRSKAVPIVRPDDTQQKTPEKATEDVEEREDEEGRPMQAEGREKRVRRNRTDGDDVPKFALQPILPSQPTIEAKYLQPSESISKLGADDLPDDKENLSPNKERTKAKAKSPDPLVLQRDTHTTKAAKSTSQAEMSVTSPLDGKTSVESDERTPTIDKVQREKKHAHQKSSLSAAAEPFELRSEAPGSTDYDFGFHVTKPSQNREIERAQDILSKFADTPSRYTSRSPATTFQPSDAGSWKTAASRRRAPYPESESVDFDPSFNDIDAVMKHMNEEGSDFGVERDDDSWANSSPGRTALDFNRTDLRPTTNSRSDAPSPSPRRLFPLRNVQGSATSLQDPFDDDRAAIAYDSTVHRLNNADEVPISDWDEGLLTEGEDRLHMRSRFFDQHVDDIMGRLLQNRLGPLEQNLQNIQNSLVTMSQGPKRSRRSMSTERLDSDADDEDDDVGADSQYRPRSPRKDRKLDKIRAVVTEALAAHQPTAVPVQHVAAEEIRAMVNEALAAHAPPSASEQIKPETLRSIVADALSAHSLATPIEPQLEAVQPDTIRSIVTEALALHKPAALEAPIDIPQPQIDMSEMYQIVGSLKASIAQATNNHLQAQDVRELVDDAFKRQSVEVAKREDTQALQEKDARIAELEAMLKEATLRSESEAEARMALEVREVDTSRLLKVTEEELVLLQKSAVEDETKIRVLEEDRDVTRRTLDAYEVNSDEIRVRVSALDAENEELKLKTIVLKASEEETQNRLDAITAENDALTSTLEEHRLSASKWRTQVQESKEENDKLRKAIDQTRYQAEESTRVREFMRSKLEKLQEDMVMVSQQIAAERAQWHKNDEISMKKYEVLSARIEAEGRTRERLERELERLETQEREGMKLRMHLEQTQNHNARLEEALEQLRTESLEHQKNAARYERDMREARDAAHVEIRRTRVLLEADIDAANNQVNIVRHDLESQNARIRAELDSVRLDTDTLKEKHELDLEAASDAKKQALLEAHESRKHSLHEQQRAFERQLEHIQHEHARTLNFAREDRERAESFHNDKLALADAKTDHLKDKVALLEEKLQIAKEAASAAIAAASKSPIPTSSNNSSGPEKISPQALRESIAVLQDQLQERESRIESFEHQLAEIDTDAPAKLKERDSEVSWLRELLGVRIDDLNDLISALAQPTFDRENVRDAAIRIRTNLQMEQQEKERQITGGQQSFPTLATLTNFASPKAVQFAAAFGNWRKGRENATSALAGSSSAYSRNQTPSRAAPQPGQSFLSGLMTPPTSNLRRTSDLSASSVRPHNPRSSSSSSRGSTEAGFPTLGKQPVAPSTPPLMRKANYDRDAEVESFSENGFYDDDSMVDGEVDGDLTPLGLNFGHDLRR